MRVGQSIHWRNLRNSYLFTHSRDVGVRVSLPFLPILSPWNRWVGSILKPIPATLSLLSWTIRWVLAMFLLLLLGNLGFLIMKKFLEKWSIGIKIWRISKEKERKRKKWWNNRIVPQQQLHKYKHLKSRNQTQYQYNSPQSKKKARIKNKNRNNPSPNLNHNSRNTKTQSNNNSTN